MTAFRNANSIMEQQKSYSTSEYAGMPLYFNASVRLIISTHLWHDLFPLTILS